MHEGKPYKFSTHSPDGLIVRGGVVGGDFHLPGVYELQRRADAHGALLRGVRVPRNAAFLDVRPRPGLVVI